MNFIAETAHTRCSATEKMREATDTGIVCESGTTGIKVLRSPWGSIEVDDNHAKIRPHIVFEHGKLELDGNAVIGCDGVACEAQDSLVQELDAAQQAAQAERYALLQEALAVAVYNKVKRQWTGAGDDQHFSLTECDWQTRTDQGLALFTSKSELVLVSSFGKRLSFFANTIEPVAYFVDPDWYEKATLVASAGDEEDDDTGLYGIISACGLRVPVATTSDIPVGDGDRAALNARLDMIQALLPEDV